MKKAIQRNLVQVNGKMAQTGTFLKGGEVISLLESGTTASKKIFEQQLDVLYEDNHCAVINKPAGLLTSGNRFRTVENALPFNLKKSKAMDALPYPRPAHRLDFPTTGVLLVAKTRTALTHFKQQFEAQTIPKTYFAVVSGTLTGKGELLTAVDSKSARARYVVIQVEVHPYLGDIALVQLIPTTGRRHQLRVQLADNETPILGDKDYGRKDLQKVKGLFLHAFEIRFEHPESGEHIATRQPLPRKFQKLFSAQISL